MRKSYRVMKITYPIAFSLFLFACVQQIPKDALRLAKESLKDRQLQTRIYDTDEKTILSASASVLQDLGFTIDESETDLGVIVCSKNRDATNPVQVVGAVAFSLFTGSIVPFDKEQLIRVSLVTHPVLIDADETNCQTAVRVTFQRVITNTLNEITTQECIHENEIYQKFFDKLSQSLFLEAHQI